MKVSELLQQRRKQWRELEVLCATVDRDRKSLTSASISRFATLYRAACADLALADEYRLPQNTVNYLHQLVGRAHNQLYRTHKFNFASWQQTMLVDVPQRIFNDGCVQIAFLTFWATFLICAFLASSDVVWPDFAETMLPPEQLEMMESNFGEPLKTRRPEDNFMMAGFYIFNNTRIGLMCFAGGLLVVPGLVLTIYNAAVLGTAFGYFARQDVPAGENFYEFVTAHGPFELMAIVLCAGAGMRLGMAWIRTHGLGRVCSLRKTASEAMSLMCAAIVLFFLAALIEGFFSPSSFEALEEICSMYSIPFEAYPLKAAMALLCSGALMFYFVILGYPRET